ncbi:MAG TPA: aminoglycoside phosphotransferase family protein [Acidimicrobiales bacterium]|nr:aminoglycoside phosphotransferase family protein [Acidimicrobiales bacterium]
MEIVDAAVPAVQHLTGPGATEVLRAAVDAAGGVLHDARTSQVQYRPGADVVVRYRADVTWADGSRRPAETLLASASTTGPLPGAVPVEALDGEQALVASVWRWPFDPLVPGLERAVTPGRSDDLVGSWVGAGPTLEVVAYRPTERAVVRVTGDDGRRVYVKAVRPHDVGPLVERHERLLGAGLPVPEVLAASAADGLVVLAERPGTTFRERIKQDLPGWPEPAAIGALVGLLRHVDPAGLPPRQGRVVDALGHARLLAAVAPDLADRLEALCARFRAALPAVRDRSGAVVHGDLHEGQLVVAGDGAITGLLDVDDVGTGDPVDDLATVIGHLRFRAATTHEGAAPLRRRLAAHVGALEVHGGARVGREALALDVAAVLVGLATGPFRIQRAGWRDETDRVVADAEAAVDQVGVP